MSLTKYGLTERQYRIMLRQQKGRCAICRRLPKTRRLAVDHSHGADKRVRGLLCYHCNRFCVGKNTQYSAYAVWVYLSHTFDGRTL